MEYIYIYINIPSDGFGFAQKGCIYTRFMAALLDLGGKLLQTNPLGGVKGGRSSRMK